MNEAVKFQFFCHLSSDLSPTLIWTMSHFGCLRDFDFTGVEPFSPSPSTFPVKKADIFSTTSVRANKIDQQMFRPSRKFTIIGHTEQWHFCQAYQVTRIWYELWLRGSSGKDERDRESNTCETRPREPRHFGTLARDWITVLVAGLQARSCNYLWNGHHALTPLTSANACVREINDIFSTSDSPSVRLYRIRKVHFLSHWQT